MIWVFFVTFGIGLALIFASLELFPHAQSQRRKTFVKYGFVICAVFALGIAVDFQALVSSRPVYEALRHG